MEIRWKADKSKFKIEEFNSSFGHYSGIFALFHRTLMENFDLFSEEEFKTLSELVNSQNLDNLRIVYEIIKDR